MTAQSPRVSYSRPPQEAQHPSDEWHRQWRIQHRRSGIAYIAEEPSDLCPEDPIDAIRQHRDHRGEVWLALADGECIADFDNLEDAKNWLTATYFKRQELKLDYIQAIWDLRPRDNS